jgi:phospholipase/carboxylesterase
MNDALVILLHGVGSRGADIAVLERAWAPILPGAAFAAPDAPFAFDQAAQGQQWFSVAGVTEADRPARVVAARPAFDATLERIVTERGFADRLDSVALVGFSQGSIMALDAVASGRWKVGAVVAFAGRLAKPEPFAAAVATPVLLVHGTADPVMPVALAEDAEARLVGAGMTVHRRMIPGLGHQLDARGAQIAGQFLAETLPQ